LETVTNRGASTSSWDYTLISILRLLFMFTVWVLLANPSTQTKTSILPDSPEKRAVPSEPASFAATSEPTTSTRALWMGWPAPSTTLTVSVNAPPVPPPAHPYRNTTAARTTRKTHAFQPPVRLILTTLSTSKDKVGQAKCHDLSGGNQKKRSSYSRTRSKKRRTDYKASPLSRRLISFALPRTSYLEYILWA
jgi:hypothetical protein